jgi:hypothetical protein
MLGVMEIQLNSPFGYDDEFAADFDSITSSCGASGYAFTSPAPYALNSTATTISTPTTTPSCSSPYLVQSGDTCDSIALAYNVSTFSIITAGSLSPDCGNLQACSSLCLPSSCNLYRVQYDDTCESILAANTNVTGTNLLSWNPNINVLCTNIGYFVQTLICLR